MWYFELFLVSSTLICFLLLVTGRLYKPWAGSKLVKFGRSYFSVFLTVLLIRSFIFQPFKVVSGSLEPTVLIGDILAVNQAAYGLRLPLIHKKIMNTGEPKKGDIALFYYPVDPSLVFVKRVIGVPGDHVEYKDKTLKINGKIISQQDIGYGFDEEPNRSPQLVLKKRENLLGIKHDIFINRYFHAENVDVTVPPHMYFMMGDNRDDSDDSRHWGFVPEENLIGRAYRVMVSFDGESMKPRFDRTLEKLHL